MHYFYAPCSVSRLPCGACVKEITSRGLLEKILRTLGLCLNPIAEFNLLYLNPFGNGAGELS